MAVLQAGIFDDPRVGASGIRSSRANLDLWRIHLDQCPECGNTHDKGTGGSLGRPERHIYHYCHSVPQDLTCALCGEPFQHPVLALCGHHYCNSCVRALLSRTAGRAACPVDGHVLTRFALQPVEPTLLARLSDLFVSCPVCGEAVRRGELDLHLQDPVHMIDKPGAYAYILRPFYMSCPLSNFTVGEFNGTASIIRFYQGLGKEALQRFVLATKDFLTLPDPKIGFQPHTDEEVQDITKNGGYFNAWWVHPSFRKEVWWASPEQSPEDDASQADSRASTSSKLGCIDCSQEPWAASSFCHTWSAVQKPIGTGPEKYLCSLRDLRGYHIPMLETFQIDVHKFLHKNFGVASEDVQIYCHYPSSARYSTLHFHIIFGTKFEKHSKKKERPHQLSRQFPLERILENLRESSRYYAEAELSYFLGDKADLMDPLAMYYGCSPHRHLGNFTFVWDEEAIPLERRPKVHISPSHGSQIQESSGELALTRSQSNRERASLSPSFSESPSWFSVQLAELRSSLEHVQHTVADLSTQISQMKRDTQFEENGTCRLAIEAVVAANRRAEKNQLSPMAWVMVGALLGAILAWLLAGNASGLQLPWEISWRWRT